MAERALTQAEINAEVAEFYIRAFQQHDTLRLQSDLELGAEVELCGVEVPLGKVVGIRRTGKGQELISLAVKYPGHGYWQAVGYRGYASPETVVYIVRKDNGRLLFVTDVLHIPHARQKGKEVSK